MDEKKFSTTNYSENDFFKDAWNDKWYGFGITAYGQEYWEDDIKQRCKFVDCWTEHEARRDDQAGVWCWTQGRDCDGVVYGGAGFVQCDNYEEYDKYCDDQYDWADGPMSISLVPLDEVEEARASSYSRDTFAEAAGY